MLRRRTCLVAILGAGLALCTAAPARNWSGTVTVTAQGTHILGNPQAQVRLTEFVSYTCPHCAQFEQEAEGPLRLGFVASGKGSVKIRHLVRDPVDMTVALLTNCGPHAKFFLNHSAFLRRQATWIGPLASASPGQRARWTSGAFASRTRAIALDFRFYDIMAARGYQRREVDACLMNEPLARRLAEATSEAQEKLGVAGTPSFAINDVVLAGTNDWPTLRPQLEARM
jgi:protein-disulfide isomerase